MHVNIKHHQYPVVKKSNKMFCMAPKRAGNCTRDVSRKPSLILAKMLPEENSVSIRKDGISLPFAIGSYLFLVQKYIMLRP